MTQKEVYDYKVIVEDINTVNVTSATGFKVLQNALL